MQLTIIQGNPDIEVIIKCPSITPDIRKMESHFYSYTKQLPCTKDGTTYLIDISDIMYFESVDKQSFAYTASDVYELPQRLYEIEEMLSSAGFIRSAKAQVVNTYKIQSLCPDLGGRIEAVMENGERLIVSRQYAKTLKERLGLR